MKIHELLECSEHWTQKAAARDEKGRPVPMRDSEASSWCLWGALQVCYPDVQQRISATELLQKALDFPTLDIFNLVHWNDNPERKYSEVISLCRRLDV